MNRYIILSALTLASVLTLHSQNKVNFTLSDGRVETYETESVERIDFEADRVTVTPITGVPTFYEGTVTGVSFQKGNKSNIEGLQLTGAGGWFETAYVKWANMPEASNYYVFVKSVDEQEWNRLDYQLVRNYGSYGRADIPGLKEGQYQMKVVPVIEGTLMEGLEAETGILNVKAHDRSGFAHFNFNEGIGAYNNDGTLKTDAKVFYVTAETAKSITTDVIQGKKTVTATGFQGIISAYQKKDLEATPLCFRIIGRLPAGAMDAFGSSAEGLQIKGANAYQQLNITIEGIGEDATVHGFGFLLRNASGIELRNFAIMDCMDDCVSIDTDNSHIWVHNLDLFYGQAGGDSDQAKGDGTIDLKGDSQYLTISYNHFFDSGKSSLCGMTSESGPNWITYHHNWFDHSDSRHPRIRTMSVHVYNNYFDGNCKYGIGATSGSDVFVEANYFRDCKYPILTSLQGSDIMGESSSPSGKGTFSGESGGSIKAFANEIRGWYFYRPWSEANTVEFDCYEVTSRDEKVPAAVKAKSGGDTYSNWDTDPSLMYSYLTDYATDVPGIVMGEYGAGRINHGDFKWTFNNNLQDKNDGVITELKKAITGYKSTVIGNYEESLAWGDAADATVNGGDSTSGAEFPFGDGNAAPGFNGIGGGEGTTGSDPLDEGEPFITSSDGLDFFYFNAENATQTNAWIENGTIVLSNGSFQPEYKNEEYTNLVGSLQLNKESGKMTLSCPSLSALKLKMLRTGNYVGSIEMSSDNGNTWQTLATLNQKKGVVDLDLTGAAFSAEPCLIKISNTSSGGLNILGMYVLTSK
ncbi:MAG: pectate lyase [Muribaculaceae bacterium]|nr:pectate lyase [Muribaculaceae bacterium]